MFFGYLERLALTTARVQLLEEALSKRLRDVLYRN